MATTFNFDELDAATHDYLVGVRGRKGRGAPGVFVATGDSLPGVGCIAGPIVLAATLLLTLTDWVDVVYDDPVRVAMLQTAGVLVGGWLLLAGFRGRKGTDRIAGNWAYADPLHLYEAYRETITVTPLDAVREAHFTHNYNNGNYQNSVVSISMAGDRVATLTLGHEARAEQLVVYLNYLAWARGKDGGDRADLPPATLGGLARYVAKNDHEPLNADNTLNLNLIELDIAEVPEEPTREGRSVPAVVPYVVMLIAGAAFFFFMAYVVNPPLRDDAIFEAVTRQTSPPTVEPRFLRAYLVDPRNTMHRDEVTRRLSQFYDPPIGHVRSKGTDEQLREGMARILESVRTSDQPVVSLRVKEENTPAGTEGARPGREGDLRTQFVTRLNDELSKPVWGQAIKPPDGMKFPDGVPPPPPIGQQLLAFIEAPEDAKAAHFDVVYSVEQAEFGQLRLRVRVDLRTGVDDAPVATSTFVTPDTFDRANLAAEVSKLKDSLVVRMVGVTNNPAALPAPFQPLPPIPGVIR
jgi:hypothetical protein